PIVPILTRDEMLDHPAFRARGVVTHDADDQRTVGHPISYAKHPVRSAGRAPALGEHHGWHSPDDGSPVPHPPPIGGGQLAEAPGEDASSHNGPMRSDRR